MSGWGSGRDEQADADNSTLRLVVGFGCEEHEAGREEIRWTWPCSFL